MNITKNGNTIASVDDWFQWAPPKGGAAQWVDGRSAKEFARACCQPAGVITQVEQLLESNPETSGIHLISAEPECQIRFDQLAGERRNADLAVTAEGRQGAVAITIEAKADETFGDLLANVLAQAVEQELLNDNSGGVRRVQQLARSLLQPRVSGLPAFGSLRYQLLTATAGTLALAEKIHAVAAILIVCEFVTDSTADKKHALNERDLAKFARRLSTGAWSEMPAGKLSGPLSLGFPPLFARPIPFFLGKTTHRLR